MGYGNAWGVCLTCNENVQKGSIPLYSTKTIHNENRRCFMKYMGSKARIISEIAPILLKDRKPNQWYVEPFAGGMNSIAYISGLRIANDNNIYLIEMWKHLLQGWKPEKITREEYIHVRDHKAMYPHYYVGWVGFNCSYSGKWFAGYAGDTKTKIRSYT